MGNYWRDDRVADEDVTAALEERAKLLVEAAQRTPSDRSTREAIKRSLDIADLDAFLASADLTLVNSELRELLETPTPGTLSSKDVERFRLYRDIKLWRFEDAQSKVATIRNELASFDAAELTQANVDLAREAAKAARMTACATVVLAVATVVLIAATLAAAWIASSGGG